MVFVYTYYCKAGKNLKQNTVFRILFIFGYERQDIYENWVVSKIKPQ